MRSRHVSNMTQTIMLMPLMRLALIVALAALRSGKWGALALRGGSARACGAGPTSTSRAGSASDRHCSLVAARATCAAVTHSLLVQQPQARTTWTPRA